MLRSSRTLSICRRQFFYRQIGQSKPKLPAWDIALINNCHFKSLASDNVIFSQLKWPILETNGQPKSFFKCYVKLIAWSSHRLHMKNCDSVEAFWSVKFIIHVCWPREKKLYTMCDVTVYIKHKNYILKQ